MSSAAATAAETWEIRGFPGTDSHRICPGPANADRTVVVLAIAARYDKTAHNLLAAIHINASVVWLS